MIFSKNKIYLIAEIANSHEGKFDSAIKLIDAASDSDADIITINSDFNTAVHNANSECGILHRTTPVIGPEQRLSLLIVVSDTIYHNAYHNVGY